MTKRKCDICDCELTDAEIYGVSPWDMNICCTKHKVYRSMYQRNIARQLAGIDVNELPYTLEQLESNMMGVYNRECDKFKAWFNESPRTGQQVLDYFRQYTLPLHPHDLIRNKNTENEQNSN